MCLIVLEQGITAKMPISLIKELMDSPKAGQFHEKMSVCQSSAGQSRKPTALNCRQW
ncbi:hypothetical protein [Tessaracoccus sp. MC1756]|uniref:hypothetical protein n=1 Tax=Tessaracoccus sp. MC1756 TaxID=2760311 RepID=UPI0015FFA92A|nr:hypothetical protein [Tessaracoccus sp. MC1756]MBB1510629.1 hypothetical protein [Tessaracoccus sp. MC1756]